MARSSRRRAKGPFATLQRLGFSRGVLGGSRGWMYLATGLWTLRTVRRFAQRRPEILISEELKPGQRIVIANGRATIDDAD